MAQITPGCQHHGWGGSRVVFEPELVVQARQHGLVSGTLEDLRALVARTHVPVRYSPSPEDHR